jgi:DNA repair protein SbcC/Rad50
MEGFLSYKEQVEIDFTSFSLACVTGENGAGKSSILDGITWALFGRARKHDETVINLESQKAEVCLVFHYEGNQYKIVRSNPQGKTKQVELYIMEDEERQSSVPAWIPLTERTLRDTDQKIIDILRLDYESFTNASFLLQGEADQFTQQNPAARKRILSQILGLEIWEKYRNRALQKRRTAEKELNQLDGRISEIIAELGEEDERLKYLGDLEEDLSRAQKERKKAEIQLSDLQTLVSSLKEQEKFVSDLANQVESKEKAIAQTKKKIDQRISEKETHENTLLQADSIQQAFKDWEEAQKSLADWEIVAEKYRESEIKRQEPLLKIAAEKARLLQISNSLENHFKDLQADLEKIPQLKIKLKEEKEKIKKNEADLDTREQKKKSLEEARQEQADAKAENPRLYKEMKDLEKRIAELEKTEGVLCPLCGQELSPDERESLVKNLREEGKDLGDRYRQNQSTLKEADQVVKDLQLQITELSLAEKTLRKLKQETDQIKNQISGLEKEHNNWKKTQKKELDKILKTLADETYADEARQELLVINQNLKDIGYDASEHDRVREISSQGVAIQEKKAGLDKAEAALKPLNREIEDLKSQLELDENQIKTLTNNLKEASLSLEKAQETIPDPRIAEDLLIENKEQEKILERKVGAAQQKVAVLEKQKQRQRELENKRHEISQRVKQYRQLEAAFGKDGVPALLIEQALPNIETKANQILDKLSGGSMSIRFLTLREYKDTKREDLRETLEIQIRDQSGFRDYELYSGGESFRINFAIRLALSHVLAQRAGARLQTLVVDEGFGSQDAIGRQRLIEAINMVQDDFEKILVITHVEQIKEAFATQLLVEKTPQGSRVTLV